MTTLPREQTQLETLTTSINALATQIQQVRSDVTTLTGYARATQNRFEVWDDLAETVHPMMREGYALAVENLRALEGDLSKEDLLRLTRRLLRTIRTFETLLAELENAEDFLRDSSPLLKEIMASITEALTRLDAKGYPDFGRDLLTIVDRVVTTFQGDDVRQLGDTIVLILNTVKALTQPEIMMRVGTLTRTLRDVERQPLTPPPSLLALLRQLNDPDVRRGLSLALAMVKAVTPATEENLFNRKEDES